VLSTVSNSDNIVIYGAGAHSNTFLGQLNNEQKNKIIGVFDRSIGKQGRYLPGLNVAIMNPSKETLKENTLIVNTSVLYIKEVEEYLTKTLEWNGPILHL
jgi:FlaA1/EpsC-like NDP-sugar epimerase